MARPKGRPKKSPDESRSVNLSVRMTPAFRDWLATVAELAGDADVSTTLERLFLREGKRVKAPPPPPR